MAQLKVGGVGTEIVLMAGDTLTNLSRALIFYMKPDGVTVGTFTAVADGTENIKYTTTSVDDLDQEGNWLFEAYVEIDQWKGYGERAKHKVYPNLGVAP